MSVQGEQFREQVQSLYSDHYPWLLNWLHRRLDNGGRDAPDIAQDVFVRLLTRPRQLDYREPRAYLSSIARGIVIDQWRRRQLENAWLEAMALLPEGEQPSAEYQVELFEALNAIDRVLDGLKPNVRQAFLWARFEGLSCREIGERLGVSRATAERYVAKALSHCYRACFDGE